MGDSKEVIAKNLFWKILERIGSQAVTLVVSVVLARLLEPEAYGTVALVTIFTTVLQVFVESGMATSLIQKKNADDVDFSSMFYFNVFVSLVLYLAIFLCAPMIAQFYNKPELVVLTRVLSITVLVAGMRNVQQAYIAKHMMFKKTFLSTLIGSIVSSVIGIYMAYAGYGVWALVATQLVSVVVAVIVMWVVVPWKPKLTFSAHRLKELLRFGGNVLVVGVWIKIFEKIRGLIIGKFYTTTDLAFYEKGNQIPYLLFSTVNSSIDSVLLPTLSNNGQDDNERLKAMARRSMRCSTYLVAPCMAGLAAVAIPMVTLLFTEKWLQCVPYLQIFCLAYIFYPQRTVNHNVILSVGHSDWYMKMEIVRSTIGLIVVAISATISVKAMIVSILIMAILETTINAIPCQKMFGYGWISQMKDIIPYVLLSLFMGISVYFLQFLSLSVAIILPLQILVGVFVYVGISSILKLEEYVYLKTIVVNFVKRKNIRTR